VTLEAVALPHVFEASGLEYSWAHELPADPAPEDQLVEGVIGRAAMSVLYGDSNSGKTFLAIDLACSIASAKRWMGRNTEHGMVVYLATESATSVRMRLQAYKRHHQTKCGYLAIVQSPSTSTTVPPTRCRSWT
jgi:putative DNA primase/helicase